MRELAILLLCAMAAVRAAESTAPPACEMRVVAELPGHPVRLATFGGRLFILCVNGDLFQIAPGEAKPQLWLKGASFTKPDALVLGVAFDPAGRLYLTANERDWTVTPRQHRVIIFRSPGPVDFSKPPTLEPWFTATYPWGISAYDHGASDTAFGPDGFLYVSSGSRTDDNEPGSDPAFAHDGEVLLTSCLWRFDPQAAEPKIEIWADGLRNSFGFCWDDRGRMFATENGPNADVPEELNLLEKGRDYGFPYFFSDSTAKAYPSTPDPPAGRIFTKPLQNFGPDGGGDAQHPLSTFEPHSSPCGITWLPRDFPHGLGGCLLIARFGNAIKPQSHVGFDLLACRLVERAGESPGIETHEILRLPGRPIDVRQLGGRIFLAEYTRGSTEQPEGMDQPGRLLEVTPIATPTVNPIPSPTP